jgi:uncharacterized protein
MEIGEHPKGIVITVRVTPRASKDAIEGEIQLPEGSALKVRLTAPPVDDRANDALRKLLARSLKVPVAAVRILSGEKNRTKRLLIEGITATDLQQRLGGAEA